MEREQKTHPKTKHNLPKYFEATRHTSFVFFKDFDIVVDKAYQPKPDCGDEHGDDVHVVKLCEEERGDYDGCKDEETAHSGRAFFLFLTLKAKVTHRLTYRPAANEADEGPAAEEHNEQGKYRCH